jgi:hypothetical protein
MDEYEDEYLAAVLQAEHRLIAGILKQAIDAEPTQEDFAAVSKIKMITPKSAAYRYKLLFLGVCMGSVVAKYDRNKMIMGFVFNAIGPKERYNEN